ncbi:MAG: DUF4178 domain-containing protein [Deltaproteobacteria bacterium]|nr:DUF4178 domain-containing protein [Deltaproteobacteria bacterium]
MEVLVAMLLAGGCLSLGVHLARRRGRGGTQVQAVAVVAEPSEPSLAALKPEDVLVLDGRDLIVKGVAVLRDGTRHWCEVRADDGSGESWVVVHAEDQDGALVGRLVAGLVAAGEPPEMLEHEGAVYRLQRSGHAEVEVAGAVGFSAGEGAYWEYARVGASRIWIRRFGRYYRCFAGERVARHLFEILPA